MDSDMLSGMVQGELDQITAIIGNSSEPELDELEQEPGFDPVSEARIEESIPEPSLETGENDPESASVKSNCE